MPIYTVLLGIQIRSSMLWLQVFMFNWVYEIKVHEIEISFCMRLLHSTTEIQFQEKKYEIILHSFHTLVPAS